MYSVNRYLIIFFLSFLCQTIVAQQLSSYAEDEIESSLQELDLPVIEIWTVDGKEPTGEHVEAPSGCWGITLINNEHVYGRMKIFRNGELLYDSKDLGMKFKLRGNTSSMGEKQPYKVKLSKKADLLFRNNDIYKDKDWALIRVYNGLLARAFTGLKIGESVGLEWEPQWEYVNLVINGEYRGDYLLMETVEREKGRIDIDKTGYLIEDDAYWWNEDVYFKGNMLVNAAGFTFKYPDVEDLNDSIISNIRNFILDFESALINKADISDYINIQNWAAWLLAQDILGQKDSAGTNRYIYKKDFDESNPFSSQLEMGPLWDFDGSLVRSERWADIHNVNYSFYYSELLKRKDFCDLYVSLWNSIKDTLLFELAQYYDTLISSKGEGIAMGRILNSMKYPSDSATSLQEELDSAYSWMEKRVAWINGQLNSTEIDEISEDNSRSVIYNVYGQRLYEYEKLERGIYIINGVKVYVR